MEKINKCLSAAGISMRTPSGQPSGQPSGAPGGQPAGAAPSAGAGGGAGGPGAMFSDAKVQAALKACGLSVPTAPAAPSAANS